MRGGVIREGNEFLTVKCAIFYDYFGAVGGAEKAVLAMAEELEADIITTQVDEGAVRLAGFEKARFVRLGGTLGTPVLKQVSASLRFALCDFRGKYDFYIFCGNWCLPAARRHRPNLWYCLSPVRAFYEGFDREAARLRFPKRELFKAWVALHSPLDRRFARSFDGIVSISENTRGRVKRYYGLDSEVIFPPVDTKRYGNGGYGDYWLSVNRLYREKRIELQYDAFTRLPGERLVVVGGFSAGEGAEVYAKELLAKKPANVEVKGMISEEELLGLYAGCRGLVCTALDEDFGLTPVEAMAAGKPVVAVDDGGYRETVVDGATGRLVEADAGKLAAAIREVGSDPGRYGKACVERAASFDRKIFSRKLKGRLGLICE
jgi:glycosyltransferase involved in cell wall biosynthesis